MALFGDSTVVTSYLPRADRIYLTEVDARVEGDAVLPAIDWSEWREEEREEIAAEAGRPAHTFLTYTRDRG